MFKSLKTAAILGLAATAAILPTLAQAAPLSTWHGRYTWEEPLGRVGGSSPQESVAIFMTHTLTLGAAAGSTGCMLNIEGYQRYQQLKCTATPEPDAVIIKLYKFRASDQGEWPSGTPLFRMTRDGRGLVTRLQALRPNSDRTPTVGRLFRQVG